VTARRFTVEEAQALLDSEVAALAERLVALRARARPLELRWRRHIVAVGSNGGGIAPTEVRALHDELEGLTEESREILATITVLGVQVKDPDRGLLDFPAEIEGGDALLCWEVGEPRIEFWHRPEDGYAGRRPL
jgi:hypothetical protein